jgi:hypothetical protein
MKLTVIVPAVLLVAILSFALAQALPDPTCGVFN